MSDAVYGLVGALGGALLTAGVAYWGPLHQQREAARQTAEAQRRTSLEAEVGRLVDIRSTLRTWQRVLDDAFALMVLGAPLDLDEFKAAEAEAKSRALRALDEVMRDGWYIPVSSYGLPGPSGGPAPHSRLVEVLTEMGQRIRRLGLAGRSVAREEAEAQEFHALSVEAGRERGEMSEIIQDRLENMAVRFPRDDGRHGAPPGGPGVSGRRARR
ncbi:hypothetical protein ACFV3R_19180 [Streptomyces sp. NPDC059740]|uniref:hypothetical protein n=1 Tax=Streptomyces sp. NPDC059740 TaxID=3346926 RepID=UPI003667D022